MMLVRWLGKSTLGLSYGLVLSEAIISPAMPSSTVRAGGIFLPIIKSLADANESFPNDDSARKLGAYLIQSQLQVKLMFLHCLFRGLCSSSILFWAYNSNKKN